MARLSFGNMRAIASCQLKHSQKTNYCISFGWRATFIAYAFWICAFASQILHSEAAYNPRPLHESTFHEEPVHERRRIFESSSNQKVTPKINKPGALQSAPAPCHAQMARMARQNVHNITDLSSFISIP